jgi:hypothetical protein
MRAHGALAGVAGGNSLHPFDTQWTPAHARASQQVVQEEKASIQPPRLGKLRYEELNVQVCGCGCVRVCELALMNSAPVAECQLSSDTNPDRRANCRQSLCTGHVLSARMLYFTVLCSWCACVVLSGADKRRGGPGVAPSEALPHAGNGAVQKPPEARPGGATQATRRPRAQETGETWQT